MNSFDMITENIAVGSNQSSYDSFDLIINLDYPNNGVKQDKIIYINENGKRIINCGYSDFTYYSLEKEGWILKSDLTEEKLSKLYNIICKHLGNLYSKYKILFHCKEGISRSSTVAIYYISRINEKAQKDVYEHMKTKRPCINPNPHFRKILGLDYTEPPLYD